MPLNIESPDRSTIHAITQLEGPKLFARSIVRIEFKNTGTKTRGPVTFFEIGGNKWNGVVMSEIINALLMNAFGGQWFARRWMNRKRLGSFL